MNIVKAYGWHGTAFYWNFTHDRWDNSEDTIIDQHHDAGEYPELAIFRGMAEACELDPYTVTIEHHESNDL